MIRWIKRVLSFWGNGHVDNSVDQKFPKKVVFVCVNGKPRRLFIRSDEYCESLELTPQRKKFLLLLLWKKMRKLKEEGE